MQTDEQEKTYQLYESTPLAVAEVPECQPELQSAQSLLGCGPGGEPPCSNGKVSEFRILKLKQHSCTTYRVVGDGVGGRHGYWLSYAFQGIGSNGRGTSSLGPSWELWHHHCHKSP
jgi:hypothetical protein